MRSLDVTQGLAPFDHGSVYKVRVGGDPKLRTGFR
jgi:hypothetical protein